MRQQEQQKIKDEKTQREVDFFWQWQEQIKQWDDERGGPPKLGQRRLKEEEWELFSSHNGSAGIDFRKYDDIPVEMKGKGAKEIPSITTFEDLWSEFELPDFLWDNIERCKYEVPTPIQKSAVPVALSGRDAMCCAQTGSGKTFAFLFPILGLLSSEDASESAGHTYEGPCAPLALVLAP